VKLLGDRALGQVEGVGGAGDAAVVGDGEEGTNLLERE
jgi:hypothetical protein